jgi:polygalacturonase
MLNLRVNNIVVNVTVDPATLARNMGLLEIPTFPLNTDGIDIAGKHILVENCWVRNYDDAVCAKVIMCRSLYFSCCNNHLP